MEAEVQSLVYSCGKVLKGNVPDDFDCALRKGSLRRRLLKHHKQTRPPGETSDHDTYHGVFENGTEVGIYVSSNTVSMREVDNEQ